MGPTPRKISRIAVAVPTIWMREDRHFSARSWKLVLCSSGEMMGPLKGWLRRSFGFACRGLLGLRDVLGWWREYCCGSCGLTSPCWIRVLGIVCIWRKRRMTTVPWALSCRLAYCPWTWPWKRRIYLSGFRCPLAWNPISLCQCLRPYFGRRREGHFEWTRGSSCQSCKSRWMNWWRCRDMTECVER